MASLNLTTADNALKEFYIGPAKEQLNNKVMLLSQIESHGRNVEGRYAVLSPHVSRNSGVGARAEGGTLPVAGSQGHAVQRIGMKYNYASIQLTGPVMRAMKTDQGSFVRAMESEIKGAAVDARIDVNRQLWGTSDGKIATCGTTSAATLIVLATATTATQMRQFRVGMKVDIGTLALPATVVSSSEITAVSVANKTITISDAVTTTSSHFVFNTGAGGDSTSAGGQKEITGLQSIVAASGTLFNVSPVTYPVWASTVLSNSGTNRTATETLFTQALHDSEIAGSDGIKLFVASHGVNRAYANQMAAQKRFNNTVDLKGGYKGLDISAGGSPVALTADKDCPENTAFGLDTDELVLHTQSDWEWMDEDGAVLARVPGVDAYYATLIRYCELATEQRNAHCRISDLTAA